MSSTLLTPTAERPTLKHAEMFVGRLEADPVLLQLAEWWFQVGWLRPKPLKWNNRRYRGGSEDKRVA